MTQENPRHPKRKNNQPIEQPVDPNDKSNLSGLFSSFLNIESAGSGDRRIKKKPEKSSLKSRAREAGIQALLMDYLEVDECKKKSSEPDKSLRKSKRGLKKVPASRTKKDVPYSRSASRSASKMRSGGREEGHPVSSPVAKNRNIVAEREEGRAAGHPVFGPAKQKQELRRPQSTEHEPVSREATRNPKLIGRPVLTNSDEPEPSKKVRPSAPITGQNKQFHGRPGKQPENHSFESEENEINFAFVSEHTPDEEMMFGETVADIFGDNSVDDDVFEDNSVDDDIFGDNSVDDDVFGDDSIDEDIFGDSSLDDDIFGDSSIDDDIFEDDSAIDLGSFEMSDDDFSEDSSFSGFEPESSSEPAVDIPEVKSLSSAADIERFMASHKLPSKNIDTPRSEKKAPTGEFGFAIVGNEQFSSDEFESGSEKSKHLSSEEFRVESGRHKEMGSEEFQIESGRHDIGSDEFGFNFDSGSQHDFPTVRRSKLKREASDQKAEKNSSKSLRKSGQIQSSGQIKVSGFDELLKKDQDDVPDVVDSILENSDDYDLSLLMESEFDLDDDWIK